VEPRVAVIIACYNAGATLRETLSSLEEQEPYELVIVDDGSDDAQTIELLEELRSEGIRVLRQPNSGPAAARMAGVRATSARYVTAVDADDLQAPGALATLADALDSHPDVKAAWGDTETFGEVRSRRKLAPSFDPWLITYMNEVPAGAMMRREALLETGGWQLEGGYEDWDLWMSFAERGWRGLRIPFINGYYRVEGGAGVQAKAVAGHAQLIAELRRRHPDLFARRPEHLRVSTAPMRAKLLLPVVDRVPLVSEYTKHRLAHLVCHPVRLIRTRLPGARRGAPTGG
jgi:glycosyltransferase involved in cell wall biosynthesis